MTLVTEFLVVNALQTKKTQDLCERGFQAPKGPEGRYGRVRDRSSEKSPCIGEFHPPAAIGSLLRHCCAGPVRRPGPKSYGSLGAGETALEFLSFNNIRNAKRGYISRILPSTF